jgi:SAM-dependent methyltransferase
LRGRVQKVIGVDLDTVIKENPNLDAAHVAPAEDMPFLEAATIDVALARYVAEHLERPLEALREIRRVLRPGGVFLMITPNRRHYVPLLARLLSLRWHKAINELRGTPGEDIFPTVYGLNTPEDIDRIASAAGFSRVELAMFEVQPNYLTFHPLFFAAGAVWERAVNTFHPLARYCGSIIARLTA